MKKKLVNIVIVILLIIIIPFSSLADNQDAYKLGKENGKIIGKVWGQRDRTNNLSQNLKKRLNYEEKYIEEYYDSQDKSKEYKKEFLEGFKDEFEIEYKKVYKDDDFRREKLEDLAEEHGKLLGQIQGKIDGIRDSKKSSKKDVNSDYKESVPKENTIKRKYDLYDESRMYSTTFIETYLKYYERSYKDSYEGKEDSRRSGQTMPERADDNGFELGEAEGARIGHEDYDMGKSCDYQRAFKEFIGQKSLESRYFLHSFPSEYRDSFITAFMEGFFSGYSDQYIEYNVSVAEHNINNKRVSMFEETLKFEEERMEMDSGTSTGVSRTTGELFIPAGAIYKPTHIGLSKIERTFNQANYKYVPVTSIYKVDVINDMKQIDLREPLTLRMPYFGKDRAGIYQLVNGHWRYLYSDISEDMISTDIPTGMYRGGQYAVFIDEEYVPLIDININWAKEELYTFLRRGYIHGYGNFSYYYPNGNISRGEFAQLIWAVEGYNSNIQDVSSNFTDSNNFDYHKSAINYVVSRQYMNGYEDGRFGSKDAMTYQQVEWAMRKILNNNDFNWYNYSYKIMQEKFTRSKSLNGKNNYITKAEVIYMLHELQKNNSI